MAYVFAEFRLHLKPFQAEVYHFLLSFNPFVYVHILSFWFAPGQAVKPHRVSRFGSADRSASSLDYWYLSVARPVAAKSVSGFNVVSDDINYVKELFAAYQLWEAAGFEPATSALIAIARVNI